MTLTLTINFIEGERVELGGIIDPEKGALIYRKTTEVQTLSTEVGSEFSKKKIKKVTSETNWLGRAKGSKEPLVQDETKPWQDEEIEQNPLYSTNDYVSDFNNPLYANRHSAAAGAAVAASDTFDTDDTGLLLQESKGKSRASRGRPGSSDSGQGYVKHLSAEPGVDDQVDTLF